MDTSVSLRLVWDLAAREAAAAQFPAIEPEHFVVGILKYAGLPEGLPGLEDGGGEVGRQAARELAETQAVLGKLGVEPTAARRRLRARLGGGSGPHEGEVLHRSSASRAAFARAADLARQAGASEITVPTLLVCLLAQPTPAIAAALPLGGALDVSHVGGGQPWRDHPTVLPRRRWPLGRHESPPPSSPFGEYAYHLRSLCSEGAFPPMVSRQAEGAAILEALASSGKGSVILVCESIGAGRAAVVAAAQQADGPKAPTIMDLRFHQTSKLSPGGYLWGREYGLEALHEHDGYCPNCGAVTGEGNCALAGGCEYCHDRGTDPVTLVQQAVYRAAQGRLVVAFCVECDALRGAGPEIVIADDPGWTRVIAIMTPDTYEDWVIRDPSFEKECCVMRIRSEALTEVPGEL